ncbi:MAG: MBL fold metallo-hydrolase [Ferruginibacter sp.]|nr:MBL fold metallo-hydrolase [Ferruginibacter sp.]
MKIAFHGAAQTVTGSKHLITLDNGKKLLLDCGLFQGMGDRTDEMNADFGFDAREVDYVVLSHAHIDHCGLLPKLVKEGYNGAIYATPATKDLASILMEDSAGIQESEAKYRNKRNALEGKPYISPLYTTLDAMAAADQFEKVDYDTWHRIDESIECCFTEAGHIIGSAVVSIRITENGKKTAIAFSGDVGRYRDIILRSPAVFDQADYILIESTYGNSLHEEFAPSTDILLEWIEKTCLQKKGKLILPAFSVGRTQEILYALNQLSNENRLPEIDYFVDSPLSMEATAVIKSHPKYFNESIQEVMRTDKDPFGFPGLIFTKSVDDSKRLNYRKDPCVIISASGMAEAGRVKHHISNNIENSRNSILLTGYCEPRSLGGRLKNGDKEVRIFGQWHEVNAEVGQIRSMSAHGDYSDLLHFLKCQDPSKVKKVFLVHGEIDVQQDFKKKLLAKGFKQVDIPERHQEIMLS